jgi:hypothetical protein
MNQSSNSTEVGASAVSKPYFPAWGIALFALFGLAAVGVVFCFGRGWGYQSSTKEGRTGGSRRQEVSELNDQGAEDV